MLNGVFVELSVYGLQEEGADVLVNQLVTEVFVETQVGKVAAALSVVLEVLGILEHVNHEVNGIRRGYFWITMQYFSDMSQASSRIE